MAVKLVKYLAAECARCGGASGPEVKPGDSAQAFLDQVANPAFPVYVNVYVTAVEPRYQESEDGRAYTLQYESDHLNGAAAVLKTCDIVSLFCKSCCEILSEQIAELTTDLTALAGCVAVKTWLEFKEAIDEGATVILITEDIYLLEDYTVPSTVEVRRVCDAKLIQSEEFSLVFNGILNVERFQFFSNFEAGKITGIFGGEPVLPEWWGLEDEHHDKAINAAVQTAAIGGVVTGVSFVSLGRGVYTISRPIDGRGRGMNLIGAGSGLTMIQASEEWESDTFFPSALWTPGVFTADSHTALIFIGGLAQGVNAGFYTVKGVYVNGFEACKAYPTKRISGISGKTGFIEENSVIEDIVVSNYTGYGIGHIPTAGDEIANVNGLTIRNFWIGFGFCKRDSYGIYFGAHTQVLSIQHGTIACSLPKQLSASYDVVDGNPVYTEPEMLYDYQTFGISVGGFHVKISNVHLEGMIVGIACIHYSDTGTCSFDVSDIDGYGMMDRGMVYVFDPARTEGPAPAPASAYDVIQDSCLVLICGESDLAGGMQYNLQGAANVRNLHSAGYMKFLLRDAVYDQHVKTLGWGQFPNLEVANLARYTRSNVYGLPIGEWNDGGTFTADAGTNVITTSANHDLEAGQTFIGSGLDLPAPMVSGTAYYVKTTPTSNTLTLSATIVSGVPGATLDITDTGTIPHNWVGRATTGLGYDFNTPATDKTYFELVV